MSKLILLAAAATTTTTKATTTVSTKKRMSFSVTISVPCAIILNRVKISKNYLRLFTQLKQIEMKKT